MRHPHSLRPNSNAGEASPHGSIRCKSLQPRQLRSWLSICSEEAGFFGSHLWPRDSSLHTHPVFIRQGSAQACKV